MSNIEDRYAINWEEYKQPIVLKCKNWDGIPEHYMFYKELKRLRDILDDFNKVAEDSKKNGQADECDAGRMFIQKEMSKVIAISGERGSGKTSLLKSLKNILEKEYHVFDIIGPEVLSSDLSIIDIFVSMLRDIVISLDSECFSTCVLTKLNTQLKSITAAISVDKQKEDYFKNGHSDSSILESLNKRVHLDKLFGEFLEDLLVILQTNNKKPKDFVLIIDDLDLVKNQLIAKLLNDIQRYLDKKIIIIFAYRERQLENSLFEDLITDNQKLLEREVIDNGEVFSQINQFLLKLVPLGNRVPLFSKYDLLNKDMQAILKSINLGLDNELRIFKLDNNSINYEENQGLTVENWFYKFVFIRTDLNIRPIDSRENTQLLLPQSLREIIQVAEIFSEMKPLKKDKGYTKFFQGLIENLSEFKQYIDYKITSQFSAHLSMLNFFKEWDSAKPYSKNYLTYSFIYNIFKNKRGEGSFNSRIEYYPFNLSNREEYNLTIGDVLTIIEEYKRLPNRLHQHLDYHFCYLIKINYSIFYCAYMLRGDDPELYIEEVKNKSYDKLVQDFDYRLNFHNKKHRQAFENSRARNLYFQYHYSEKYKRMHDESVLLEASEIYIEAVKLVQFILRLKIFRKEISIESNPTSNRKISFISKYIDLPLIELNSMFIKPDSKYNLPISINTDDSAIFQTDLSLEYAYVVAALLREGYDIESVYQYIEYLVKMSKIQSFINRD